ncbi:MAG: ATP-binding protein [Actinomycetota bacterium]|nr:ATP-binding protein [Actinomycetota bacterium]
MFDRFRSAGPVSQNGAGLGLAIVKAVTDAHGGRVRLQSVEGLGTTVEVVLPASCVRSLAADEGNVR